MLRFPNPGSTIENFVRAYCAAFERLNGRTVDLDEIVDAVVQANLATSSGYMGTEAVARSTRTDRSLDPLYNLAKMYAELFRMLGWLHRTAQSALHFNFTLLGEQIVAAGHEFAPLLEECALGIVYPNPILAVKGEFDLRPFAFILRVMAACDGHISRDEMIVGPLTAASDRGQKRLADVVQKMRAVRRSATHIRGAVIAVSESREVQINTLGNYTRWPIALLRDLGWATPSIARFQDGRGYRTFRLTERGWAVARRVGDAYDLRADEAAKLSRDQRVAIATVAHYRMLERSGFDISPVEERVAAANAIAAPVFEELGTDSDALLFSPFQSLTLEDIAATFPGGARTARVDTAPSLDVPSGSQIGRDDRSHLFVRPTIVKAKENHSAANNPLRAELAALLAVNNDIKVAAKKFAEIHASDTQTTFYPLVAHLFQILGFKSECSRPGVNYQRWDACVWVGDYVLPIEIKSPTEEIFLSTKAVRQAMENKVVLLARGGLRTQRELTSLIIGNRVPNERGEMSNLIDDVFKAYGLRLGVIDLTTLGHLALRSIRDGETIEAEQLSKLRGFFDV